jgi:hypothetical protein
MQTLGIMKNQKHFLFFIIVEKVRAREEEVKRRENADAQAASTDGRATLYANGQAHMFKRKKI